METLHALGLVAFGFALGWLLTFRVKCSRCNRSDARLPGGGYQPLPVKGGRNGPYTLHARPPPPPAMRNTFACGHAVGNVSTCSCGSGSEKVVAP